MLPLSLSSSSYRNITIENCLQRYRRLWDLSQMILWPTLRRVFLIFCCTLTMLCASAAWKDCSSLIISRTQPGSCFWEMLFDGWSCLAHYRAEQLACLSRVTWQTATEWTKPNQTLLRHRLLKRALYSACSDSGRKFQVEFESKGDGTVPGLRSLKQERSKGIPKRKNEVGYPLSQLVISKRLVSWRVFSYWHSGLFTAQNGVF